MCNMEKKASVEQLDDISAGLKQPFENALG